ncbi:Na+/H+ antiporter [Thorsellia kenyensis]|uniref:Na+/H+ antiporter n=1 Tax=Thorsellia kenyensis TaxID=1549888 RepID=A0ABV6C784_9GAMM
MDILFSIIILLFVVALSSSLVKLLPFNLPAPILQIFLGALVALPPFNVNIRLNPEVFLFLFLPPLLFTDGWRFPKKEFYFLKRPILALAVGLVFFTILIVGYFIHWMIPVLSLPMAFALAAVLSPTDVVAVNAISGQGKLPSKLKLVLEGEALLNDATGLVAFKFALVAGVTGVFSFKEATGDFLLVALGGILIGASVAWMMCFIQNKIARFSHDEPGIQVIVLLLIPFLAYLLANEMAVSGVLAAVCAGMTMTYSQNVIKTSTASRLLSHSIWIMLEFVLNGLAFILMGLQLPHIMQTIHESQIENGTNSVVQLLFFVVAIYIAMLFLRFIWVYLANKIKNQDFTSKPPLPQLPVLLTATFAGVRGAITLAAIMAIPFLTSNGAPFPNRELLIFLASGVILLSLIVSSLVLPAVVKYFEAHISDPIHQEIIYANQLLSLEAIDAIRLRQEELLNQLDLDETSVEAINQVADNLVQIYERESNLTDEEIEKTSLAILTLNYEAELHIAGIKAERKLLDRLHLQHRISEPTFNHLLRDMDLRETLSENRQQRKV